MQYEDGYAASSIKWSGRLTTGRATDPDPPPAAGAAAPDDNGTFAVHRFTFPDTAWEEKTIFLRGAEDLPISSTAAPKIGIV
jgi:hypothetical protein